VVRRASLVGLLKEPLLHFIVAGALLALVLPREPGASADAIVLSDQRWADLMRAEERNLTRAPTKQEQSALLERHLADEVMYREALRLGLGDDDQAVRKRLIEKARAVARGAAEPPNDDVLARYFDERRSRYSTQARAKMDYVFYAVDRHDAGPSELVTLKEQLERDPARSLEGLGEVASLARGPRWSTHRELTQMLGGAVADLAFSAPLHAWAGPTSTAHGSYLIRVQEREPSRAAALAEARDYVQADWVLERGQARERSWLIAAAARYRIGLPEGLRWEPTP
jgi:hypothetical protein